MRPDAVAEEPRDDEMLIEHAQTAIVLQRVDTEILQAGDSIQLADFYFAAERRPAPRGYHRLPQNGEPLLVLTRIDPDRLPKR